MTSLSCAPASTENFRSHQLSCYCCHQIHALNILKPTPPPPQTTLQHHACGTKRNHVHKILQELVTQQRRERQGRCQTLNLTHGGCYAHTEVLCPHKAATRKSAPRYPFESFKRPRPHHHHHLRARPHQTLEDRHCRPARAPCSDRR